MAEKKTPRVQLDASRIMKPAAVKVPPITDQNN